MSSSKRRKISDKPRPKFDLLPLDIIKQLLLYFNYDNINKFCRTSAKYYQISNDESFWVLYAKSRSYPSNMKNNVLLNELGFCQNYSMRWNGSIQWVTHICPEDDGLLSAIDESWGDYIGPMSGMEANRILFRNAVTFEIPHRGRPEKLQPSKISEITKKKCFIIRPNTPVGSTMLHVFNEIYKEMYDLKKSELTRHVWELNSALGDPSQTGTVLDILYDKERDIYHLDISY